MKLIIGSRKNNNSGTTRLRIIQYFVCTCMALQVSVFSKIYKWYCLILDYTIVIYIYIYIRLKMKPNSVRIRFQSCQIFVLPSTGFEPTPLIHCSTIRLALCPAPSTTSTPYIYIHTETCLNQTSWDQRLCLE